MKASLVFLLVGFSTFCHAATNANWVTPVSWSANENPPSTPARSALRSHEKISDISPYSPGSHNIALDLGQVFLMGDLTRFNDSIGTNLHYNYGVSDLFAFDGSFGYSEHSDGKFSMTSLTTGMRMNMSWYDRVIPYATFGLGFYRPSYKDMTAVTNPVAGATDTPTLSSILFGVHLGTGIDLELSRNLFFGASLTFHNIFGASKTLANGSNLNLGGTFASFFLHMGVTF